MKLIYSNNYLDRPTFLLAQSFSKETRGPAYNILVDYLKEAVNDIKPDFVILNQSQMTAAKDFFSIRHNNKDCVFLTITTLTKKEIEELQHITNLSIYNLSPSMFCHINEYYVPKIKDDNYWLCDIGSADSSLLKRIQPLTYPLNNKQKIRLVNNDQFHHPQNVGLVSEIEMLDLISECSAFINVNNNYLADAVSMNKPILSLITNNFVPMLNNIDIDSPQLFKTVQFSSHQQALPSRIIRECLSKYQLSLSN